MVTIMNQTKGRIDFHYLPPKSKKGAEPKVLTLGSSLDQEPAALTVDEEDPRHKIPHPHHDMPYDEFDVLKASPTYATLKAMADAGLLIIIDRRAA